MTVHVACVGGLLVGRPVEMSTVGRIACDIVRFSVRMEASNGDNGSTRLAQIVSGCLSACRPATLVVLVRVEAVGTCGMGWFAAIVHLAQRQEAAAE